MPELPEVETMKRHLRHVLGAEVRDLRRPRSSLRPITVRPSFSRVRRVVRHSRLVSIERMGKRLILWAEKDAVKHALVIEPRMTGSITLLPPSDLKHLRLVLELHGAPFSAVYFWDVRGLGVVQLATARGIEQLAQRLGEDALQVRASQLQERLRGSFRPIKLALMDQGVVAGIGNLYASEILFHAGIHPLTACRNLAYHHWRRLVRSVRHVLRRAIATQGSTLGDGTYRNPMGEHGQFQYSHYVYQKEGEMCLRCRRGIIQRIAQSGRSTFFCPVCQRFPG